MQGKVVGAEQGLWEGAYSRHNSWLRHQGRLPGGGDFQTKEAKDNGKGVKTAWGQHARQGQHCKVTEMRMRMVYLGWW